MSEKYSVHDYAVEQILNFIKSNEIAIPEIQRPFVWKGRNMPKKLSHKKTLLSTFSLIRIQNFHFSYFIPFCNSWTHRSGWFYFAFFNKDCHHWLLAAKSQEQFPVDNKMRREWYLSPVLRYQNEQNQDDSFPFCRLHQTVLKHELLKDN